MKLILRSLVAFYRDDGPLHAGSIAYFFLMSFAPFCLLLIAIFGYFLGDNKEFYEFFATRLMRFFPEATSEISVGLAAIVTYRKIGILTLIVQLLATGKLIGRFGVGRAAAALPLVFVLGFLLLAVAPMLLVVVMAVSPRSETLCTVVAAPMPLALHGACQVEKRRICVGLLRLLIFAVATAWGIAPDIGI